VDLFARSDLWKERDLAADGCMCLAKSSTSNRPVATLAHEYWSVGVLECWSVSVGVSPRLLLTALLGLVQD
jgi:hypothetical protein